MTNSFYPMHLTATEFSVVDANDQTVFPKNPTQVLDSLPAVIAEGNFSYRDGRRMVVSDIGTNSTCLAYLIDALWGHFKQHYGDIESNKLWLRPLVKGNYKETWNTVNGEEETIQCEDYSFQSFYTFPEMYISSFDIPRIVRIWNAYVGIPWVLLDRDHMAVLRARVIKPANKYKIMKMQNNSAILVFPHISSAALFSPAITWFIYALAREALALGLSNNTLTLPPEDEIAEVVNGHSLTGALELWSGGLRTLGLKTDCTSYSNAFWPEALATFEWLVQNGGVWALGLNPKINWMLHRSTIGDHCSTLMAWERQVKALKDTHHTPALTIDDSNKIRETTAHKLEEMQK